MLRAEQAKNDRLVDEVIKLRQEVASHASAPRKRQEKKRNRHTPSKDLTDIVHYYTIFGYMTVTKRMFKLLFKMHREKQGQDSDMGDEEVEIVGEPPGDGFGSEDDSEDVDQRMEAIALGEEKRAIEILYELLEGNDMLGRLDDGKTFQNQVCLQLNLDKI